MLEDEGGGQQPPRSSSAHLNLCILAMLPISFSIGFCSEHDLIHIAGMMVVVMGLNYLCFLRLARLDFGNAGLLTKQTWLHFLLNALSWLVSSIPWALTYQNRDLPGTHLVFILSNALLAVSQIAIVLLAGTRTVSVVSSLGLFMRGLLPLTVFHPGVLSLSTWTSFIPAMTLLPVGFAKYQKDQCSISVVTAITIMSTTLGARLDLTMLSVFWVLLITFCAYIQMLWMRQQRVLPVELRGCKFVTLSYLRQIAATGEGIRRCQDLPADAFGDPRKAKYVIAVSHRWMNPVTCDVKTDSCPEGLKLQMLVKTLDSVFSPIGIGRGQGCLGKLQRIRDAMTGGSDVLLFLDFMSLPQVGHREDGSLIERTPEETKIFQECLPSMGILYSMFPALVLPEVGNCPAYMDSGWCFSECSTAWLGGQLAAFASNSEALRWFEKMRPIQHDLKVVGELLDRTLESKTFLYESDREIARTMIRSFVLKRRLVLALRKKLAVELENVLEEMNEGSFDSLVNQPVDDNLNTPLHYAVRANFQKGVEALLDAGADKHLRNLQGDTPVQRLMFPCLRRAAMVVRRYSASEQVPARTNKDFLIRLSTQYTISTDSGCNSTRGSFIDPTGSFLLDIIPLDSSESHLHQDVGQARVVSGDSGLIVSLDDEDEEEEANDPGELTLRFNEDQLSQVCRVDPATVQSL